MKVSLSRNSIKFQRDNESFVSLMVLIIATYSFFGYLLPKTYQYSLLVIVVVGLLFYSVVKANKIRSEHVRIICLLIIFTLLLLLSASYSAFPDTSKKTAIFTGAIMGIGIFLSTQRNWYDKCLKYFLIFSMVHVFFTLFSYLFPSIFSSVILPLLPGEISSASSFFMTYDLYAGITEQIGRNSFYITVGIGIMAAGLVSKSKKVSIQNILLLSVLIITLLLTGKRGPLLSNILAVIAIISLYAKVQHKSIAKKILLPIVAISILILTLITVIPEAATPFMRLTLDGGGDITSGRSHLYSVAIELFKEKPILGWGLGSFAGFQDMGTHNVYLQLLCETGIIGALVFVLILVSNLLVVNKAIKNYSLQNRNTDTYLLFSLYVQIFYIAYGMTGNPLNDGFILVVYIIAMSIPYAMNRPTNYINNIIDLQSVSNES